MKSKKDREKIEKKVSENERKNVKRGRKDHETALIALSENKIKCSPSQAKSEYFHLCEKRLLNCGM